MSNIMQPIQRFRYIFGAFSIKQHSWSDVFWIRFAAQMAILLPDSPEELVAKIEVIAKQLERRAPWFSTLKSPLRFAIAVAILHNHDNPRAYVRFHKRMSQLLAEAKLPHSDVNSAVAILILRQTMIKRRLDEMDILRLRAYYDGMKEQHWWLTGPEDLPICAALMNQPHSHALKAVARVEFIYERLGALGIPNDEHRQTIAGLLALTHEPDAVIANRYCALHMALSKQLDDYTPNHYLSLVPLSLLHHDADQCIEEMLVVHKELTLCEHQHFGESDYVLAADLTFLDMVHYDRNHLLIRDGAHLEAKMTALHDYRLMTTAMLSFVHRDQETMQELGSLTWSL